MSANEQQVAEPRPWTVRHVDGWWCVYFSDDTLGAKFALQSDARTFADVAGPGDGTVIEKAKLARLRAELAETRAASDSAVVAINPDTGIVHRRMSDGSWYALDVIPGRDAVADENLLLYFPQQVTTYCPCITKSCQHPPGRCSGLPDTALEMHSWLLGGWQRWMFCRGCADVAVARWPGEARIVGAAPTGAPTVERVAKATAWFAVAALLLVAAIEAARGGSR